MPDDKKGKQLNQRFESYGSHQAFVPFGNINRAGTENNNEKDNNAGDIEFIITPAQAVAYRQSGNGMKAGQISPLAAARYKVWCL